METDLGGGEKTNNVEDDIVTSTGPNVTSVARIPQPDPVVYKPVDYDGILVPATDAKVMVVEDFLKDDEEEHFAAEGSKNEGSVLEEAHVNRSVGQSCYPEKDAVVQSRSSVGLGETTAEEKEVNLVAPVSVGSVVSQLQNAEGCSSSHSGACENGSSAPAFGNSRMPDFSRVKGKICLDSLTVKDLQETFRAIFGRETSVKDKQWLKRRIAMGLTNSCSFETTTFVIEDSKVIKISKEETCRSNVTPKDIAVDFAKVTGRSSSGGGVKPWVDDLYYNAQKPGASVVSNSVEDANVEQRAEKRVRKPTKRYIEELSENESREAGGKLCSSMKSSEFMRPCSKPRTSPVLKVQFEGKPVVKRPDSFGGSGIEVPYVSRIRRGRPRESYMALMPCSMPMSAKRVSRAFEEPGLLADEVLHTKVLSVTSSSGWIQQHKEKHYMESTTELDEHLGLRSMDEFEDDPDVNMFNSPTHAGEMRRKHHRPWSLTEVIKLVEGVSKYGAGRWSEIKRLAFASYSYRTSVDLKDKWRNLLRASFAQLPKENGMQNMRKPASIPLPESILLRVRELAQMQSHVSTNISSSNFSAHSGSSLRGVHESGSSYVQLYE